MQVICNKQFSDVGEQNNVRKGVVGEGGGENFCYDK